MSTQISNSLLGKIIDRCFGGAIEDDQVIRDIFEMIAADAALALPASPVEAHAATAGVSDALLTINGYELRDALDFLAPDGTAEQLEQEVTIQRGPERTHDEGTDAAGLYCWLTDYPEEGSIRLDDVAGPLQRPAPVAATQPPVGATFQQRIHSHAVAEAAAATLNTDAFQWSKPDREPSEDGYRG